MAQPAIPRIFPQQTHDRSLGRAVGATWILGWDHRDRGPTPPRQCPDAELRPSRRGAREDPAIEPSDVPERTDRLLPWIAAERGLRAVVLVTVGLILVTHPHANWASEITRLAQRAGLDPSANWFRKLIEKIERIQPKDVIFGIAALAYGVLEGVEAYGLWRGRRWGEWLTVLATSLLLVPEIWELTKSATVLKLGALIVNLLVVAYLLWRLRGNPAARSASDPIG